MPSLYPNILFHFTSKSGLYGILDDNFRLSYSRERIEGEKQKAEFGVPMVSFCDLRLSELKDHMSKYGQYGIGLSKDWANRKGLNPVFYVNRTSKFTADFMKSIQQFHRTLDSLNDLDELKGAQAAYMGVLNSYRFMKNYEATLVRPGQPPIDNFRFADEREWRYVPALTELEPAFVPPTMMQTMSQKQKLNAAIDSHRLEFEPDDVRYLVVDTEKERLALLHHLDVAKRRFGVDQRRRLASRVLTAEQIQGDI